MNTYLFSYPFKGSRYALDIQAESVEEAYLRVDQIQKGLCRYDGTQAVSIGFDWSFTRGLAIGIILTAVLEWWLHG